MGNINSVHLSGRLTRDPDIRTTPSGSNVLSLSLAVNERRKNPQNGQWEDYPNYVDCTMFGARADPLSRILHKGQLVCIEGKLHYSSWERDGQKRSKLEVVIGEIEIPQGEAHRQGSQPAQQAQYDPAFQNMINSMMGQPAQYQQQSSMFDEDVPF